MSFFLNMLGPKRELELEQKVEQLKTMGFEEVSIGFKPSIKSEQLDRFALGGYFYVNAVLILFSTAKQDMHACSCDQ